MIFFLHTSGFLRYARAPLEFESLWWAGSIQCHVKLPNGLMPSIGNDQGFVLSQVSIYFGQVCIYPKIAYAHWAEHIHISAVRWNSTLLTKRWLRMPTLHCCSQCFPEAHRVGPECSHPRKFQSEWHHSNQLRWLAGFYLKCSSLISSFPPLHVNGLISFYPWWAPFR